MSTLTDRLGGARTSLAIKAPCRVASTANLTLSGFQTVDGVVLASGDDNLRVLVKNQTTASENGIWIAQSGVWQRARDFDGNGDVTKGTRIIVAGGSTGVSVYKVTTADPITIGTTSLVIATEVETDLASGVHAITDVASAATCDIGAATTDRVRVTGTTTITSLGTDANTLRYVHFAGALTLTHNATSLILPGAVNIATAAGDSMVISSDASGNWRCLSYQRAAFTPFSPQTQTLFIPANAMRSRTTNGAPAGAAETTTNKVMLDTKDFDATTQEFVQFALRMPKSWDEGAITAAFTWSHAATATNFGTVWGLQGRAFSDGDVFDAAFGTEMVVADIGGTTDKTYITSATSAITIGGTPQAEDYVVFQVFRDPANGFDTMAIDARLHGVTLYLTVNAPNDN